MRFIAMVVFAAGALFSLCGCPAEDYPNLAPATLVEINQIRNSTTLTPAEQRSELEALGLNPETINALLQSVRLANQLGGSPRSAYDKVVALNFTALTPDEVQLYGDGASNLDPNDQLNVQLTDDEAQAIVTFFRDHSTDSPDELAAFLDDPGNSVPSVIPAGVLRSLFIDFDPKLLIPKLP